MTQKEGTKKNKALRILLKIVGGIAIAILLFIAIVYIVNVISNKTDQKKIETYGQLVPVDGKKMNVTIQGEGEETIVLLPGFGTAAPAIDFKPLIEELAPYYRVAVVEPFGYGLSDMTDKERNTANIVSEVHEALQALKIDRYILMGHSIAGIYGIDYVNKYENEVIAFAGIDSSVPTQPGMDVKFDTGKLKLLRESGFGRLLLKIGGSAYDGLPYDDKTKEQLQLITLRNAYTSNYLNEMVNIYPNFQAAQHLTFPKELPLIFFIQANNPVISTWVPLHEEQIKDSVHGKVITMDGEHYLHHTKSKEIAEDFRAFMKEIK
ncbi:alpha/beta hydrolase [Paenibacillus radicis (ex Gao et al. 2016)]|uniref:Alpha/beta hydrolase n=1 Tax=Paenibacillus radicis (ex Gao et al. 2016) TaxID=1737354 RepID=A0A917GVW4_9BACL|nr:alpha/beta hydrolase [Paenibacillus radicis (ex Gao et al. 2016)]GGG58334.1 alpha/beta hydrolase [Paenibacillus radicis (ex Gao et al. 2016)]